MRAPLLALTVVAGALAPSGARATPQDLFGYGGRSPGLAMTGVAFGDDYEAAFGNPAGLSRATERGIFTGLHAGVFELELDGERFPFDASRAQTIGFQLPLPFGGPLEDRLVLGAAFYTPISVVLRNEVLYTEVPQWPVLVRAQVVSVMAALGVDLSDVVPGLRVGLGMSALADTIGTLRVRLDEANQFVSQTETQLLAGFAPIAGVTLDIDEQIGFGLVYRSELSSNIDIDITVRDLPVEIPVITIDALAQYDPHTLAFEATWRPREDLMFVAHGQLRLWSLWPGVQSKTSASSHLAPDPAFQSTFSPRIAVEKRFALRHGHFDLRGGYLWEPTPAPPARLAPGRDSEGQARVEMGEPVLVPMRYLDNARHVFTTGVGIEHRTPSGAAIHVDVYGQLHVLAEREHEIPQPGRDDTMTSRGIVLAGGWTGGVTW